MNGGNSEDCGDRGGGGQARPFRVPGHQRAGIYQQIQWVAARGGIKGPAFDFSPAARPRLPAVRPAGGRRGGFCGLFSPISAGAGAPLPVAVTLGYAAVALTLMEYYGNPRFFAAAFPAADQVYLGLYPHPWWAGVSILLYLPVPLLIIRCGFRRPLRDYGLRLVLNRRQLALYGLVVVAMLPLVLHVSTRADFLQIYPFHGGAAQVWEAAYALQFVAREFFFRGLLVLGVGRYLGRYSVWVAVVPYTMLHSHKPPLEAFAAIVAGIILGEAARRTGSILGGVLVHVSVALGMDGLALRAR